MSAAGLHVKNPDFSANYKPGMWGFIKKVYTPTGTRVAVFAAQDAGADAAAAEGRPAFGGGGHFVEHRPPSPQQQERRASQIQYVPIERREADRDRAIRRGNGRAARSDSPRHEYHDTTNLEYKLAMEKLRRTDASEDFINRHVEGKKTVVDSLKASLQDLDKSKRENNMLLGNGGLRR